MLIDQICCDNIEIYNQTYLAMNMVIFLGPAECIVSVSHHTDQTGRILRSEGSVMRVLGARFI